MYWVFFLVLVVGGSQRSGVLDLIKLYHCEFVVN